MKPPPPPSVPTTSSSAPPPNPKATSAPEPSKCAHEGLNRGLPLPDEYRRLQDVFVALETTMAFFRSRNEPCFFAPLRTAVQKNTQREFSASMLRRLLGVWAEAYAVEGATVVASRARALPLRTRCLPRARARTPRRLCASDRASRRVRTGC